MCCGSGQQIPYQEVFPEDIKKARSKLMSIAMGSATKNATPFPSGTPVAAGTNSAKKNALNLMGVMSTGKPFSSSKPITYGQAVTEKMPAIDPGTPAPIQSTIYCKYPVNRGGEPVPCGAGPFQSERDLQLHMESAHGTTPGPKDDPPRPRDQAGYFDPYSSDNWLN